MEAAGINAIEVTAGIGNPSKKAREGELQRAYFRERTTAVRPHVSVPVMAMGGEYAVFSWQMT